MKCCVQGLGKIAVARVKIAGRRLNGLLHRIWSPRLLAAALMLGLGGSQRLPAQNAGDANSAIPDEGGYSVIEAGPHHRVWQKVIAQTNSLGNVSYQKTSFKELATGLNFLENNQWIPSSDTISLTPDGGEAAHTQHKVHFSAQINTVGAIDLLTPTGVGGVGGVHLRSTISGVSYYDASNNRNLILAELQDSTGQLLQSSNQVLYTNALADTNTGFHADVLYSVTRSGFSQDVLIRTQPPDPQSLGLNPHTTILEIWSEFFSPPEPTIGSNLISAPVPGQPTQNQQTLIDQPLDWGTFQIGSGAGFSVGASANTNAPSPLPLVPVAKRWIHQNGRTFLVEEILFDSVVQQLSSLPTASTATNPPGGATLQHASLRKSLPFKALAAQAATRPLQLAQMDYRGTKGFMLDYPATIGSYTNFTFQSDTTYDVTGNVNLYGNTTIEGGSVIKNGQPIYDQTLVYGPVVCNTSQFRPAVFTSANDNSIGTTLPGSTGNPSITAATTYLYCYASAVVTNISNIRFCYAWNAFASEAGDVEIWDCQFIDCQQPIAYMPSTTNMGLHNVLFREDNSINNTSNTFGTPPGGILLDNSQAVLYGENVTADMASRYFVSYDTTVYNTNLNHISFTNSIVTSPQLNPRYFSGGGSSGVGVQTNAVFYSTTPPTNVFHSVGAGNYYLATNSPCRGLGTTNVNPAVLADIQTKTTYPPVVINGTNISGSLTLSPQAPRDTNSSPDCGYHYSPLDYALVGPIYFLSNSLVTVAAGTDLALVATNSYGSSLTLEAGSQFSCQGTPNSLNHITACNTVQESTASNWCVPAYFFYSGSSNTGASNLIYCRFTAFSLLGDGNNAGYIYCAPSDPIYFQDCQFLGGWVDSETTSLSLINCLFERPQFSYHRRDGGTHYLAQ